MIDEATVRRIAALSRLSLSDEEVTRYAREMSAILDYAGQLPDLPSHGEHDGEALRMEDDRVIVGEQLGDLLQNALATENGYVKVPAILDRSEDS